MYQICFSDGAPHFPNHRRDRRNEPEFLNNPRTPKRWGKISEINFPASVRSRVERTLTIVQVSYPGNFIKKGRQVFHLRKSGFEDRDCACCFIKWSIGN